ncbi:MAG: chaperone protein DnaJ [Cyanobacteria bacterium RYN_339]|nr:chaperone protein DnaJ [Cyanobacteria bacterium RYN_339]
MASYYEILGLPRAATADDVRRAFRREAKRLHPDKAGGANAGMVGLNEAYETLKDPVRRRNYDATLARPLPPKPAFHDPFEYVLRVFAPLDAKLWPTLKALGTALAELEYDIYDDAYVARFGAAVTLAGNALDQTHRTLFSAPWPEALASGLNLYRQGLRQAEDAMEDFDGFTANFDVDVLVQGRTLLSLAVELLAEARAALVA